METLIGKVMHYYSSIGVASIEFSGSLEVGNQVHIKGQSTNFDQTVESIEVGHRRVKAVNTGDRAGLKVNSYVRKNDCVYKIEE